jgi:uncharacterized Fe-S cluster-containing radical SAM superfamily protein
MSTENKSSSNTLQEVICRQSQLKFIQDYASNAGLKLTLKDTIALTEVMVDYCINGWTPELKKRIALCDDYVQSQLKELLIN